MGFAGERLRPEGPQGAQGCGRPHGTPGGVQPVRGWWVRLVTAWPVVTIVVVLAGLGALAYPAKDLQMALPDVGALAARHPGPRDLRRDHQEVRRRLQRPADPDRRHRRARRPGRRPWTGSRPTSRPCPASRWSPPSTPNANVDTGMVQIIPTTGPDDPATANLVERAPRARRTSGRQSYDVDTAVTGFTAIQIDVTDQLGRRAAAVRHLRRRPVAGAADHGVPVDLGADQGRPRLPAERRRRVRRHHPRVQPGLVRRS